MSGPVEILLVDDDQAFRELVVPALEARGYTVVEAHDAASAAALTASRRFDVAIVDAHLPDRPGIELIEELRRRADPPAIVYASAYFRDRESLRALTERAGVARVLTKPFSAAELRVTVEALTSTRAPRSDADAVGDRMEALRARYRARLPEKLEALARALDRAREDSDALREAGSNAHKLHGTAGAYGFPAVGALAAAIEAAVERVVAEPDETAWSELLALRDDLESLSLEPAATRESAGPPAFSLARVLLVDDDPDAIDLIRAHAKRRLIDLRVAKTGAEALSLVRAEAMDAAIVDVHLGAESGFTVARALRAVERHRDLPIAFLSADVRTSTRIAAIHAGGSLFLAKPLVVEAFADAVFRLSSARREQRAKLLLLDADDRFAHFAREVLGPEHIDVIRHGGAQDVLEAIDRHMPDLVLADVALPELSGFDVARLIRSTQRHADLPVVLLTDDPSAEVRVACFEAGADDYVAKPVVARELVARAKGRIERARLRIERAERDPLTHLLLRRAFAERMGTRLAEAERTKAPLALALIDVDHFKSVNDTHGHLAGDRVLAALGGLLASSFRASDLRGRWGGEEFVVALYGETAARAAKIIERVLAELRRLEHLADDGRPFHVTFSAGIAQYPTDGDALEPLIRSADRRLYEAKAGGRNRVVR